MTGGEARLKIDLAARQFEVSGPVEFVTDFFPKLKEFIDSTIASSGEEEDTDDVPPSNSDTTRPPDKPITAPQTVTTTKAKARTAGVRTTRPVTIPPKPVDLKAEDGAPSLQEFFTSKIGDSANNQEAIPVIVYYLHRYKGMDEVELGHIVTCFNALGRKKPGNMPSVIKNVRTRFAYLDAPSNQGPVKITVTGENLVEHALPRKNGQAKK